MKNKLIYILSIWLAYTSAGCTQQEIPLFREKSGVFFTSIKTTYSFRDHFGVDVDTVYMPVSLFGDTTDVDRVINVKVVEPDSALLANPERYRVLSGVLPAGKFEGQVGIEINNGSELADTIYSIYLEIVPNDDFPELVEFNSTRARIEISDVRIPPANWEMYGIYGLTFYFGKYEDEWWDYILEVTGKSSLPWNMFLPEPNEEWPMSNAEMMACVRAVKNALQEHEYKTGEKLRYKNGDPWTVSNL